MVCEEKAVGDLICVMGLVLKQTYIPVGIKRKLVRYDVNCSWKGEIVSNFILIFVPHLNC